jgi:hypothetical protein
MHGLKKEEVENERRKPMDSIPKGALATSLPGTSRETKRGRKRAVAAMMSHQRRVQRVRDDWRQILQTVGIS